MKKVIRIVVDFQDQEIPEELRDFIIMRRALIREGFTLNEVDELQGNILRRVVENNAKNINQENHMIAISGLTDFSIEFDNPETFFLKFLRPSFLNSPESVDILQKIFSFKDFAEKLEDQNHEDLLDLQLYFNEISYRNLGRCISKFCSAKIAKVIEKRPSDS